MKEEMVGREICKWKTKNEGKERRKKQRGKHGRRGHEGRLALLTFPPRRGTRLCCCSRCSWLMESLLVLGDSRPGRLWGWASKLSFFASWPRSNIARTSSDDGSTGVGSVKPVVDTPPRATIRGDPGLSFRSASFTLMVGVGLNSFTLSVAPSFSSSVAGSPTIGLKKALPAFFSPSWRGRDLSGAPPSSERCRDISLAPPASFCDPDSATSDPNSTLASRGLSITLATISEGPESTFIL